MAQKNDPFIGSNWGWDEGENGWGLGLNETLIQLAFLQNRRIDGIVSSLPETPADGEAYFLTLDKRVYFRVDGSWYGSDVPEGMDFILKSTEERYEFDGTTLTPVVVISDAVDVDYNNSVSGLTADNVQDAVDELVEELSGKVDVVAGKQLSTEDYTTAEKNKLSGIEVGATANETDAYLLNRANHEGTQPQSTIENLVADLNAKQTIANLVQDLSSPNSTTYLSTQGLASAFADIVAGEVYKGEWDADTNTPPLTSGVGVQGEYYQVSVAGNTTLDGISSWALGDEVLFDGTVWKKRANYQSVVSVNGQTGPVTLSATDVGAVSSITMTVPTGLQVSGSPITSSGTLAVTFQSGYSIPTNANQANWTIAYNERNRWDGGATGLDATTGRNSLGLGTASQANLVTSNTDTTAGRVLTVGSGGWLGLANYQSAYDFDALGQVMQGRTMISLSPGTKPSDDISGFPDNCFVLPAQRSSGNNMVQLAIAFEGGYSRMAHRHYSGSSWSPWVESWTTGNTSADVQWMLGAADIPQIRSRISAAKATVIRSVASATHNFDEIDNAAYHRFTFSGAKTATVRNSSSHTFDTNYSAVVRNAADSGNLTIVASSGVTINPPYGGTLVLEPGMTVTLFKVGINEWDLIGQTVPA